jgi:hypothetical protein
MLKELWKQAGWTVLSSSDATGYNASGDMITSEGSGANGMDNQDAWFRIEDPSSNREYAFQRKTASYSWVMKYSRSAGFTTGGGIGTCPTASDEVGLASGSTSAQTMFPTGNSWRVHAAAQNATVSGVYAWWLLVYDRTILAEKTVLFCEPLVVDAFGANSDNDPLVHHGEPTAPTEASISDTSSPDTLGYMMHGRTGEEYGSLSAVHTKWNGADAFPKGTAALTDNPHTSAPVILPMYFYRHVNGGVTSGYKGVSTNLMWVPSSTYAYTDIFKVGTNDYYVVFSEIALRGWPTATLPTTAGGGS